jgi:phosphate transport system protein
MSNHLMSQFDTDLNEIRAKLLEMGGKVEKMIHDAMKSLVERNTELAGLTIEYDHEINRLEVEIDERCLEVLALRQPTARDLRFITLAMKIVTDLERIGDKCRNIAKRARELNDLPPLKPYIDLPRMAVIAASMVTDALDAFVRWDEQLAYAVCHRDSEMDLLNEQIQRELLTFMIEDTSTITRAIKITSIARGLERIADHATNVAEMVIFMVKGKDIRHTKALLAEVSEEATD